MTRRTRISVIVGLVMLGAVLTAGRVVYGALPSTPGNPPAGTGTLAQRLGQGAGAKISPQLLAQFQAQPAGTKLEYWVILADQADTSNNIPDSNWADKGWYVYKALTQKAAATQPAVLAQLQALRTTGQVSAIQSFWIINSFVVTGDLKSAEAVAANAAVAKVREPGKYHIMDSPDALSTQAQAVLNGALLYDRFQAPLLIQHNISEVHAPQAWTLGYDGTGITVGSMDTGTRWTHEALNARYRGIVAPPDPAHIHDYDWFDGYSTYTVPTDNNGHGTHTMGTIVGTSPNAGYGNIGVAKGAQWITVRICATSACDLTPIMNGFQWTLAPTRVDGSTPRPDLRPRISSNSWGNDDCSDNEFQTAVTNWVNAGIFPDFANGNSGPGAGSVGVPAAYPNSWGTGALDTSTPLWTIASFSSRGPSCYDGSIRPQALAPGVNILSSYNGSDTDYEFDSGTSMATPHLAGAVTILQQKNPNLTIAQYEYALTSTAYFSPTWGTRPNNDYGWGLIQIDAALAAIPAQGTPTPTASGTPPTATRTATALPPTATPTCDPGGPITRNDSVVPTDPTKHSVNGAVASTCAGGPCPGDLAANFHYKAYQFTNPSANPVCVTVSYDQSCLYSDSYLGSFDPNNGCTNYLGAGSGAGPTSYAFTVPGNATFWVVAEEYVVNASCANYTLTITGLPTSCATPTATATNTPLPPTATRTRTPAPPTLTSTAVPPTLTRTAVPPTLTSTSVPPTFTQTAVPPTLTRTPVPPTLTPTAVPPTATATAIPPTVTRTPVPPTLTATAISPTVTRTPVPPTLTSTPVPPTLTRTPVPPTLTATAVPPTLTRTPVPPTLTATAVPPTLTRTAVPPTLTPTPLRPTFTRTALPPTVTATRTLVPPSATGTTCATETPLPIITPAFTPGPGCSSTPAPGVVSAIITDHPNTTTALFTNNSATCSYPIGLAVYRKVDANIDHQVLYDYALAVIPPHSSLTLTVNNPTCAYQGDAFWGNLIVSFAGGDRYGTRRLDDTDGNGSNYCSIQCLPPPPPTRPPPPPTLPPPPPTLPPPPPTVPATTVPCSLCNVYISDINIACNGDGSYHWSVTVRNNASCTVNSTWQDQLQIQRNYGGWHTVLTQTGNGSFPPGDTTVAGNACYVVPPNTTGVRHVFKLTGNPPSCRPDPISPSIAPCPVQPTCSAAPGADPAAGELP